MYRPKYTLIELLHEIASHIWAHCSPGDFHEFREFAPSPSLPQKWQRLWSRPRTAQEHVDFPILFLPTRLNNLPQHATFEEIVAHFPRLALQLYPEFETAISRELKDEETFQNSCPTIHLLWGHLQSDEREAFFARLSELLPSLIASLLDVATEMADARILAAAYIYVAPFLKICPSINQIELGLRNSDTCIVQAALYAWKFQPDRSSLKWLRHVLAHIDHTSSAVRLWAMETLDLYTGPLDDTVVSALLRRAADSEPRIQFVLLFMHSLAQRAELELATAVRQMLEHEYDCIRARALWWLCSRRLIDADQYRPIVQTLVHRVRNGTARCETTDFDYLKTVVSALLFRDWNLNIPDNCELASERAGFNRVLACRVVRRPLQRENELLNNLWTKELIARSAARRIPRRQFNIVRDEIIHDVVSAIFLEEQQTPTLGVDLLNVEKIYSKVCTKIGTITRRICRELYLPRDRQISGWHIDTGFNFESRAIYSPLEFALSRDKSPFQLAYQHEVRELLSEVSAIALTPHEHRIVQMWTNGNSKVEIGRILNIAESTVRLRLTRAIQKLREQLPAQFQSVLFSP